VENLPLSTHKYLIEQLPFKFCVISR